MTRRFLVALVALLVALPGSAQAGKGSVLAPAATHARRAFTSALKTAEGVLASATTNFTRSLASGAMTPEAAANAYGAAFAFFATTVHARATDASTSFATEASAAISTSGLATLPGSQAGEGGTLDVFTEQMQSALDAARRRALGKARRFATTFAASGGARRQMHASVMPWPFDHRAAPAGTAAIAPADAPIRLLVAVATRLDDGKVVVSLGGSAPPSASGNFDVRLAAGTSVNAVGPLLSAGGMLVAIDGTWSVTATLNDPLQGQGVAVGNRIVEFGVEPFDAGIAGRQPARYLHGGTLGIP